MDRQRNKFGGGPKELGGAVDLINKYKLWPYHELFCKRSLPLSISESHYLRNVVGDTQIRKGEGMKLDQLFHNTSFLREKNECMHPFDLSALGAAFQMRETTPVGLPSAEKGIPTAVVKPKIESRDKERKHNKHKGKDKQKDRKKHKHHNKDTSSEEDRKRSGIESCPENLMKQHDKKRKHGGW